MSLDYDRIFPDERDKNEELTKLRQIQLIELRMLKIFDDICRKNGIDYFIDWGNLIGAVRHKGFIPWDDDIDIAVSLEDYIKLHKILPKELPNDIFFQTYETDKNYGNIEGIKLRDKYSNLNENKDIHDGIFIEVFPMYKVPDKRILQKLQITLYRILISSRIQKRKKIGIKSIRKLISNVVCVFIKSEKLEEKILNMYKLTKDYKYRHALHSSSKGVEYYFKKESVFPTRDIEYEGCVFRAPADIDDYLKTAFGNYMELPPVESRDQRHMKLENVKIMEPCNHSEILKWKENKK